MGMTGRSAGTLIVGACQAGVQLATSLRELGDTEPIVLVGEEPHAPYQRPPLSKAFLKGEATAETLTFRTHGWYADKGIELAVRERIVQISRDSGGGEAVSGTGRVFPFKRLALATGAAARRIPLEGAEQEGVGYLRDADEAEILAHRLRTARHVAVIGGGFIGLEVAAGARAAGKHVTVIEAAPRLVGRAVSEATSGFYLQAHRRRGTEVILDARVARITGRHGRVTGVELGDGTVVPADVVLVWVGVVPRTELAEQLGLAVENGIVVDARALASDGLTVAAGDCANLPNPFVRDFGSGRIRLESVQNAVEQAKIAAATLLGHQAEYRTVPWFWSDQADLKLQIAGLSAHHDQVVLRGNPDTEKFSVLYYRGGRLLAADCLNSPADFMAVRTALAKGLEIPADAAADTTVPLKKSVRDAIPV